MTCYTSYACTSACILLNYFHLIFYITHTVESTSSIAFTPKFGIMNQTSTILCSASGNPRLKLKLTKDGITLKETSDNSSDSLTKKGLYLSNLEYTINQTTSSDRGIYTCEAAGQRVTHSSEFFDVWSELNSKTRLACLVAMVYSLEG